MSLSVALLAIVGLFAAPTHCAPADLSEDPGAWLAKELGMDTVDGASAAFAKLQHPSASKVGSADNAAPAAASRAKSADLDEAGMDELIKGMTERVQASGSPQDANELARAVYNKIAHLRAEGRYIEALVENRRLRQACVSFNGCSPTLSAEMGAFLEAEMHRLGDRAVVGVPADASPLDIRKAHRKLVLLLHPDKNRDMDEEGQKYLEELFLQAQQAYENLKRQ